MSKRKTKKNKNTPFTTKDPVFNICIISAIISCGIAIIYGISGLGETGFSALKILSLLIIPELLIRILGFYIFTVLIRYLYKKNKILSILFILLILVLVVLFIRNNTDYNKTYNLSNIYDNRNNIIIDNNKLYYNVKESYEYTSFLGKLYMPKIIAQDTINYMDLDGKNNKILCKNPNKNLSMEERDFLFVKNNELYYSSSEKEKSYIKKINLSNCKETEIKKDYNFIKKIDNDKMLFMYRIKDSNTSIIKYDIDNNKKIKENNVSEEFDYTNFIIDYNNLNLYYKDNNGYIYKNNKIILKVDDSELRPLLLTSNYLFVYDYDYIYQIELNTNKVINKIDNKYKEISNIFSDTNDNYFFADDKIYYFNEENNSFDSIIKDEIDYEMVYHYGDKMVFDDNNNNIIVYDNNTNEIKKYKNVLYSYDNNSLYIISKSNKKVTVDKID